MIVLDLNCEMGTPFCGHGLPLWLGDITHLCVDSWSSIHIHFLHWKFTRWFEKAWMCRQFANPLSSHSWTKCKCWCLCLFLWIGEIYRIKNLDLIQCGPKSVHGTSLSEFSLPFNWVGFLIFCKLWKLFSSYWSKHLRIFANVCAINLSWERKWANKLLNSTRLAWQFNFILNFQEDEICETRSCEHEKTILKRCSSHRARAMTMKLLYGRQTHFQ